MKIKLTGIYVDDSIEAPKFYTGKLNFLSLMLNKEYKLAIVVSPEYPNPTASKYQRELFEQGLPVIVLGVKDVQTTFSELTEKGIHFIQAL
mgnify:CR=1 FL=1